MARIVCREEKSLALERGVFSLIIWELKSWLGAMSRSLNTRRYFTRTAFHPCWQNMLAFCLWFVSFKAGWRYPVPPGGNGVSCFVSGKTVVPIPSHASGLIFNLTSACGLWILFYSLWSIPDELGFCMKMGYRPSSTSLHAQVHMLSLGLA